MCGRGCCILAVRHFFCAANCWRTTTLQADVARTTLWRHPKYRAPYFMSVPLFQQEFPRRRHHPKQKSPLGRFQHPLPHLPVASAMRVWPAPVGPKNGKFPTGRPGEFSPARNTLVQVHHRLHRFILPHILRRSPASKSWDSLLRCFGFNYLPSRGIHQNSRCHARFRL